MDSNVRTIFIVVISTLLSIGITAQVNAQNAPHVEESEFETVNEPAANCGDFIVIANGAGRIRLTTFFDRNGDPDRLIFQGRYNGTLTNSITGTSISDSPSVANIFVDLVANTQTNIGAFYNVTIPGHGAVLFEAGRIVFAGEGEPVFIAGPHHPPNEFIAILCDALR